MSLNHLEWASIITLPLPPDMDAFVQCQTLGVVRQTQIVVLDVERSLPIVLRPTH